jgi:hypothetical protein
VPQSGAVETAEYVYYVYRVNAQNAEGSPPVSIKFTLTPTDDGDVDLFLLVERPGRCHVIELHRIRIFIYIPYAKDQIWAFNLVYIYADWYFC